ncbi:MAG: winged helix-turn-helix domain-containing protein [Candidatus Poribacteria bacterium]|nr:winged helix-turn-helix domain-containing protein [Candidatus Poribacteria bacterium]
MAVSNLPMRNEIHQLILTLLSDEKEHRFGDIVDKFADHFYLTDKELDETVASGYKRFYHRCSFAMQDLKAEDLVESPKHAYWKITKRGNDHQNRITPRKKETRENTGRTPSKSLQVPNLIRRYSMKNKKAIIRTCSRRRSYGKKGTHRQLTGRKQRAIERARVREVEQEEAVEPIHAAKPVENATPTETKIPWRAPRSKPDPGTYACRTIFCGIMGIFTLPFAIIGFNIIEDPFGLYFFLFPIIFFITAIRSLKNSRGGW